MLAEESKTAVDFSKDEEVLSSDEEQERIEEEKSKFTATVTLGNFSAGVKNIVVTPAGNAQALTKILFTLTECGKAEVLQEEKTKEVLKVFYVQE